MEPTGVKEARQTVNTWKNGIRDSIKSRNFKVEECFDRELWRKIIMSLG
jgi:hypothetical protein